MNKQRLKRMGLIMLRTIIALALVVAALCAFVWFEGIQITLALLTGSLRDPYFDDSHYAAEQNCRGSEPCSSSTVRVLTYNVLCRICVKEEHDPWDMRVMHLANLVKKYDPDLIGSQELGGWKDIAEYLSSASEYECVTFEFGPWTYADSALFYKKSRYELLDSGQFWLSPKPWLPFGFSWLRLSAPRYLTWAHLRDRRSGFSFLFMNSHVDNNPINKEAAAGLIFEVFSKYARRMPVIFTGDFNTNPTTDRYRVFQQGAGDEIVFFNTADLAPERSMQPYIPNGQDTGDLVPFEQFEHMIDHIFVAGPLQKEVFSWIVDYNTYGSPQRDASDHPALFSELRLTLDE